jgi:hypothetical protein
MVGGHRDLLLGVQLQKVRPGVRKLVWQVSVPIVGGPIDIFHANHGLDPADHVHESAPHAAEHGAVSMVRGLRKRGSSSRRSAAEKRHQTGRISADTDARIKYLLSAVGKVT